MTQRGVALRKESHGDRNDSSGRRGSLSNRGPDRAASLLALALADGRHRLDRLVLRRIRRSRHRLCAAGAGAALAHDLRDRQHADQRRLCRPAHRLDPLWLARRALRARADFPLHAHPLHGDEHRLRVCVGLPVASVDARDSRPRSWRRDSDHGELYRRIRQGLASRPLRARLPALVLDQLHLRLGDRALCRSEFRLAMDVHYRRDPRHHSHPAAPLDAGIAALAREQGARRRSEYDPRQDRGSDLRAWREAAAADPDRSQTGQALDRDDRRSAARHLSPPHPRRVDDLVLHLHHRLRAQYDGADLVAHRLSRDARAILELRHMASGLGLCFPVTGIFLLDKFGRKPLFAFGQLCSAIPLLLLFLYAFPGQGLAFLMAMFMLGSAFNSILALGLSTYTAELYPTEMRAVGVGVGNAWVRFAAVIGPIFLGWASVHIGLNNAYLVYAIFGVIGGLTVIFVAIETKGTVLEILSPSLSSSSGRTASTPKPQTGAAE